MDCLGNVYQGLSEELQNDLRLSMALEYHRTLDEKAGLLEILTYKDTSHEVIHMRPYNKDEESGVLVEFCDLKEDKYMVIRNLPLSRYTIQPVIAHLISNSDKTKIGLGY